MQKYENAVILAACEVNGVSYRKVRGDLVIAADRGFKNAEKFGINPDIVLGDFDSLEIIPNHENLIKLPREKDDTDTAYAVKLALECGVKRIFILGGMGGRLDHTFANIELLSYTASKGARAFLLDGGEVLTVLKNETVTVHGKPSETVSVFSLSDKSIGVCERGFKYTLTDAELDRRFPLGVSNEFSRCKGEIEVQDGELLVIFQSVEEDFISKNRHDTSCINNPLNLYLQ